MTYKRRQTSKQTGFTIVELLVVLGIISSLIALLLPSIERVRQQALSVACKSNMRQIGAFLYEYYEQNPPGFMFPTGPYNQTTGLYQTLGTTAYDTSGNPLPTSNPATNRWPYYAFGEPNPPYMICPADENPLLPSDPEYANFHSYVVNQHLIENIGKVIRFSMSNITGSGVSLNPPDVILMGEKVSTKNDYYMEAGEFDTVVEQTRHGVLYGSNYLYLDMHVDQLSPKEAKLLIDPWDVPGSADSNSLTGN